jgi:hypothetical protein
MAKIKPQHQSCTKLRRMLIRHGTLNMQNGAVTEGAQEWVTRECGTPLFGQTEREHGICRSCASGWTHPENCPVENDGSQH